MKKKMLSLLLVFVLAFSLLMTSCDILWTGIDTSSERATDKTDSGLTRADVTAMIADFAAGNGNINNYNINVTDNGSGNLLAASKSLLSSVSVWCKHKITYTQFSVFSGIQTTESETESAGSGVIYKLDKETGSAYILTNYHVVYYYASKTANHVSDDITVYLYGQESTQYAIPAKFVGGSMNYDLAVLKVENSPILKASAAREAVFADSNEVAVMETCIAVGNPEATGISATVGTVNVDSEYINISMQTPSTTAQPIELRVMRIDAAVNSGNSGGGLYNNKGELIGIVNAKDASSSVENIGYAIPSNIVGYIAENIIDYCDGTDKESVYRCILGITVKTVASWLDFDEETGKIYRRETVMIDTVEEGSLASQGLKVGDVVRSLTITTGEKTQTYEINRLFQVIDCMLNVRVGSHVSFSVVRNEAEITVELDIPESTLTQY